MRRLLIALELLIPAVWLIGTRAGEAAPAATLKLEVSTIGGKTFRIGETIPLQLLFTAAPGTNYEMDTRNYDRGGRLNLETYSVEPRSGWQDPLATYSRGVFVGGGLGTTRYLAREQGVVTADLNEWVRFDKPGQYRLTVYSNRVRGTSVASNPIPLTIVEATPEWQELILRNALAVMAGQTPPRTFGVPIPANRREAIRSLRFLGTPAAARELAKCVPELECVLGLAGSPARKAALDAINSALPNAGSSTNAEIQNLMKVLTTAGDAGQK